MSVTLPKSPLRFLAALLHRAALQPRHLGKPPRARAAIKQMRLESVRRCRICDRGAVHRAGPVRACSSSARTRTAHAGLARRQAVGHAVGLCFRMLRIAALAAVAASGTAAAEDVQVDRVDRKVLLDPALVLAWLLVAPCLPCACIEGLVVSGSSTRSDQTQLDAKAPSSHAVNYNGAACSSRFRRPSRRTRRATPWRGPSRTSRCACPGSMRTTSWPSRPPTAPTARPRPTARRPCRVRARTMRALPSCSRRRALSIIPSPPPPRVPLSPIRHARDALCPALTATLPAHTPHLPRCPV